MVDVAHLQALATQDAIDAGFPPDVFVAQINQESGWNPQALSPMGAQGIAQIMPATAAAWGVDPWNPEAALKAAANAMAGYLHQFGDVSSALAAYNAGPGAVQQYGGVPAFGETQAYVRIILAAAGNVQVPATAGPTPDVGSLLVPAVLVLAALWISGVL